MATQFGPYPPAKLRAYRGELNSAIGEKHRQKGGMLANYDSLNAQLRLVDLLLSQGAVSIDHAMKKLGRSRDVVMAYNRGIGNACGIETDIRKLSKYT